jgi:hypothetical protein
MAFFVFEKEIVEPAGPDSLFSDLLIDKAYSIAKSLIAQSLGWSSHPPSVVCVGMIVAISRQDLKIRLLSGKEKYFVSMQRMRMLTLRREAISWQLFPVKIRS